MSRLSLYEKHEYSADWSVPGSSQTISGQLEFRTNHTELNLNNAFTPLRGTVSVTDAKPIYPAVHGISSKGEALTLLKAQSTGVNINLNSAGLRQAERLISSWVIVGAHVTPETLYSSVRFFVPGLETWLSRVTITETIEPSSVAGTLTATFVVQPPEPEATLVPAIDATLEWGCGTTMSTNPFKSISVDVHGWVVIRPHTHQPLEWFLKQQGKLAALLAFTAGIPMPIDAIEASAEDSARPLAVLVTLRQAKPCELKNFHDFFIPRGALGTTFPTIVANWFREIESVLVPSQLVLGILTTDSIWLHVAFSSLIQALEGFHRGRREQFTGIYMDESKYESVKSALNAAIPTEVYSSHRDALRSRIRYGNQVSLSRRLDELRDYIGDQLARLIIAPDGKIPRSWIDTRNYHSHWDEELRDKAIDGQAMYYANIRMEHFLRVLYLLMTGIPVETILQSLTNSSHTSQQLAQLNIIARRAMDPSAPPGVLMTITGPPTHTEAHPGNHTSTDAM